jgi:hypothetical protein
MTTDNRTQAEREYDRTALSTCTPADQGPFGVDEGIDEMIDRFERLEAAFPEATPQQILALAASEQRALGREVDFDPTNKYHTGEWNMAWMDVETPIATLPDGSIISGTYEVDGSPSCVHLEAADGQFFYGSDGSLAGDWADIQFEDVTIAQVEKLAKLLPLLPALIDAAKQWCKE